MRRVRDEGIVVVPVISSGYEVSYFIHCVAQNRGMLVLVRL